MKTAFWISAIITVYTLVLYPAVVCLCAFIKRFFFYKSTSAYYNELPELTFVVCAYNEADCIKDKIQNIKSLVYPAHKLNVCWITDGSTDGTPEIILASGIGKLFHSSQRLGKAEAVNRLMLNVKTELTVFSDANTITDSYAIINIVNAFSNSGIGAVAGEKRVVRPDASNAASHGESVYWRYESFIKKCESDLKSSLSVAGELYAIRTALYKPIESDTLIDDFTISLNIRLQNYNISYCSTAFCTETPSLSIADESIRKKRIAAGGIQTFLRYFLKINPFKFPFLSFQYFSHKLTRWILLPYAIFLLPLLNILLIFNSNDIFQPLYLTTFAFITLFYVIACIGLLLKNKKIKSSVFFIPYYTLLTSWSTITGFFKQIFGLQSAKWDKARRVNLRH